MINKFNKNLLKGSLILLIAFNAYNFLNFVFHFIMARMLTIAEYGVLAVLFSIIYTLGVFTESIQTIITRYTTNEKNEGKINDLLRKSFSKVLKPVSIIFILYLFIAFPLSYILKINYFLLALTGLIIFPSFSTPITRGIMQGRKMFLPLGMNMIYESVLKLFLAVLFVWIGWKVYGAMAGVIIGVSLSLLISFISLRKIMSSPRKKSNTIDIYNYARPTLMVMAVIIIFYSLDIILAKIFFSAEVAGAYAIASILSKTIFWGTQPIARAMFPLSAEKNNNSKKLFLNSLFMLIFMIFCALLIFFLFPDFIIYIFSGKEVPLASNILLYLGIATSILSLTNLNFMYKLSKGKIRNYYWMPIFILIEISLFWIFSSNLIEFSLSFITSSLILLCGSMYLFDKTD